MLVDSHCHLDFPELTGQLDTVFGLMRENQIERANGQPIAILKNSALIGYYVPVEAMPDPNDSRALTRDELTAILKRTRETAQPALDYLKDK